MNSISSSKFASTTEWLRVVLDGEDVILRGLSALEHLGLFDGFVHYDGIEVYAKSQGIYDNIDYRIVDTFDNIEYVEIHGLRCTSINFTVNELISEIEDIEIQPLLLGLAGYFFSHNDSFDGLEISDNNITKFNEIKDWAIHYYDY